MSVDVTARNLESNQLALTPTKLRFTTASTEVEYRAWFVEEGIPMTRLGMQLSVVNWLAVVAVVLFVDPPDLV
ncbi:MAG: hypothetical protein H0V17_28400, partial [Deltaproteobacteria bacterium]|nr:hypothetical protein [Deltaproteobacteria bacterium]